MKYHKTRVKRRTRSYKKRRTRTKTKRMTRTNAKRMKGGWGASKYLAPINEYLFDKEDEDKMIGGSW